jgi:hypothetical protein
MHRSPSHRRLLSRLFLVAALSLLAAACGDDGGGGEGAPATTAAPNEPAVTTTVPVTIAPIPETGAALSDLQLNVVEFGPEGYVEIINTGSEAIPLAGVFICEFPDYADLGDVAEVASLDAGATTRIAGEHLGGISAEDGEAALYDGDDFGSSDAILSYVQWGSGDHQRSSVAAEAGLWPATDVFVSPDPAFNSIESGGFAAEAESWS